MAKANKISIVNDNDELYLTINDSKMLDYPLSRSVAYCEANVHQTSETEIAWGSALAKIALLGAAGVAAENRRGFLAGSTYGASTLLDTHRVTENEFILASIYFLDGKEIAGITSEGVANFLTTVAIFDDAADFSRLKRMEQDALRVSEELRAEAAYAQREFERQSEIAEQGETFNQREEAKVEAQLILSRVHKKKALFEHLQMKVLMQAAERGESDAQHNLGNAYHKGDGIKKDDKEAERWWRKSAEQGNIEAQNILGQYLFQKHRGESKLKKFLPSVWIGFCFVVAGTWVEDALTGNQAARSTMIAGLWAIAGSGLAFYWLKNKKDYKEAIVWLQKAAAQGYGSAKETLDQVTIHQETERRRSKLGISEVQLKLWCLIAVISTILFTGHKILELPEQGNDSQTTAQPQQYEQQQDESRKAQESYDAKAQRVQDSSEEGESAALPQADNNAQLPCKPYTTPDGVQSGIACQQADGTWRIKSSQNSR